MEKKSMVLLSRVAKRYEVDLSKKGERQKAESHGFGERKYDVGFALLVRRRNSLLYVITRSFQKLTMGSVVTPLQAIFAGQFSLSLMQAMFMFYYVKVFLNVFHVSQKWFNIAQFLYMIWNAINDPLFGYMQEMRGHWFSCRTTVIRVFAPFLCASFAFLWFPWSSEVSYIEGIHLIVALFLYDTFYSALSVAWGGLFADSTKNAEMRVAAMKYSQLSILLSVNVIPITEKLTGSLQSLHSFQLVTVVVSLIGFVCLRICGSMTIISATEEDTTSLLSQSSTKSSGHGSLAWAWILTKEIYTLGDFRRTIAANFLQTARSVAHLNFASTAIEVLIPQDVLPKGSVRLSIFYAFLTLGPQLLVIAGERVILHYGTKTVLSLSFAISVLSGFSYILANDPIVIMIFMLVDSITVHSGAPLFNIVVSDVIDEDKRVNKRESTVSALIFSLQALFVKPAVSIAPVLVVYLLNLYEYQDYLQNKKVTPVFQQGMKLVLFGTPLVLGALQYIIFRNYSIDSRKKQLALSAKLERDV